jgi:hypothetical protein
MEISTLPKLSKLYLSESKSTSFEMLHNLPSLLVLELHYVRKGLSNSHWCALSTLHLTSLIISSCSDITDVGFLHISKIKSLTELEICFSNVSNTGLKHLTTLADNPLVKLDLCGSNNITDEDLECLTLFRGITTLGMSYTENITDKGVRVLSKLPLLTSLDISESAGGTDSVLLAVCEIASLHKLSMRTSFVTDDGLCALSKLNGLTTLDLGQSNCITDAGMREVARLRSLTSLDITGCPGITDAGISALHDLRLTKLRRSM